VDRAIGGPSSHLAEREVGEGNDVQRGGLRVLWPGRWQRDGEGVSGHGGMGRLEELWSKDSGARAWTSATRSATVMPICSAAGKRSCRAAILWRNRDARLGGDSEKRLGEIR